ncbi:MAG: molecular chaperone TorD family protein [Candidatus Rokubacteria bacterium]|nr:molecular chaperone TorD family protein [Candidatus Rokubacteria bacterium]
MALCRSGLYEALALGFQPPTAETVVRLASPEGAGALADAAARLDEARGSELAPRVHRLGRHDGIEALASSFGRLFGPTARGGVPPYETEYGEDSLFQPMQEMSDLAAFYRAFGLELAATAHERIDHISSECEFLLFLARKEAYALERDDRPMLDATRQAARRFLRDHLGRWAPTFGRRLAREDPGGFFGALGTLCADFVALDCAQAGVAPGPEFLRLRSVQHADAPMACGSVGDLLQIRLRSDCPGGR